MRRYEPPLNPSHPHIQDISRGPGPFFRDTPRPGAFDSGSTAGHGLLVMLLSGFGTTGELPPCVAHVAACTCASRSPTALHAHCSDTATHPTGGAASTPEPVGMTQRQALAPRFAGMEAHTPLPLFYAGCRMDRALRMVELAGAGARADMPAHAMCMGARVGDGARAGQWDIRLLAMSAESARWLALAPPPRSCKADATSAAQAARTGGEAPTTLALRPVGADGAAPGASHAAEAGAGAGRAAAQHRRAPHPPRCKGSSAAGARGPGVRVGGARHPGPRLRRCSSSAAAAASLPVTRGRPSSFPRCGSWPPRPRATPRAAAGPPSAQSPLAAYGRPCESQPCGTRRA